MVEPNLFGKSRLALGALPWAQEAKRHPEFAVPVGGAVSVADLARAVETVRREGVDEAWLLQTLTALKWRALLFTAVPDVTLAFPDSPLIPCSLNGGARARLVATLLVRAFRPSPTEEITASWLRQHLRSDASRWFATLSDVAESPTRYEDLWRRRALLALTRGSAGVAGSEDAQEEREAEAHRAWELLVGGDARTGARDERRIEAPSSDVLTFLSYPARLFVVARWVRALGFRHLWDFQTHVPKPSDETAAQIAPDRDLALVIRGYVNPSDLSDASESPLTSCTTTDAPTRTNTPAPTTPSDIDNDTLKKLLAMPRSTALQMAILWLHGIVPDLVESDEDATPKVELWRLRNVSGWRADQLRPRVIS